MIIATVLMSMMPLSSPSDVTNLRLWFVQSATSEVACEQLLLASEDGQSIEQQAYHAVALMMQAQYLFSPLEKLRSFNRGRTTLDRLIRNHPNNLEIRWLRHCVQQQAPTLLNYQGNIVEDARVIRAALKKTSDVALREFIIAQDRRRHAWY